MQQQPRKDTVIKIRVDPTQKADFDWVSRRLGIQLSTWLRQLGLEEVHRLKAHMASRTRPSAQRLLVTNAASPKDNGIWVRPPEAKKKAVKR